VGDLASYISINLLTLFHRVYQNDKILCLWLRKHKFSSKTFKVCFATALVLYIVHLWVSGACVIFVFQYDKIAVQIYTYNNTVNILSLAGYVYVGSMKCMYCKCNANVPLSNKSNGKQKYMSFQDARLHKPLHPVGYTVPKMSVYAILHIYCKN
jgi:hypothetical protein